MKVRWRIVAALGAVLVAAALSACGGSGSATTSSSSATATTAKAPASEAAAETGGLTVSGGGSGSFRAPGKDNTAVSFGAEAPKPELEQASRAMHGYLLARVKEDWKAACSYLSQSTVKWLEQVAARKDLPAKDCAATFAALEVPLTGGSLYESSEVDGGSLRAEGDRGFLFYRAATAPFKMPVASEDGEWKMANVEQTGLTCRCPYNRLR